MRIFPQSEPAVAGEFGKEEVFAGGEGMGDSAGRKDSLDEESPSALGPSAARVSVT